MIEALRSGGGAVIIPNMGRDWVIRSIRLPRDNQEIIFEEGVVISAGRDGSFAGMTEQLISPYNRENVTLRSCGVAFRMWNGDYVEEPYEQVHGARHTMGIYLSNLVFRNVV